MLSKLNFPRRIAPLGRNPNEPRPAERGQSMVELATFFLVLVLLLAVAVDLGRMFFSYVAVREAAQEGALYGSLGDGVGIIPRVRDSSSSPVDLWGGDVEVTWETTPADSLCAGNTLSVTVVYDFQFTMPLISAVLGDTGIPISLTATSTILRPVC